jgi:hypothetical protein
VDWKKPENDDYIRCIMDTDGGTHIEATIFDGGEEFDTEFGILLPLSTDQEQCKKKCEMLLEYVKKFEQHWQESIQDEYRRGFEAGCECREVGGWDTEVLHEVAIGMAGLYEKGFADGMTAVPDPDQPTD